MMSIVQANKLKKNKLVVELSIPLGTKNNNTTLQVPIIPNNHSIHSLIPFPLMVVSTRLNVLQHQLHTLISHTLQIQKQLLNPLRLIPSLFLPPRFIVVTFIIED